MLSLLLSVLLPAVELVAWATLLNACSMIACKLTLEMLNESNRFTYMEDSIYKEREWFMRGCKFWREALEFAHNEA